MRRPEPADEPAELNRELQQPMNRHSDRMPLDHLLSLSEEQLYSELGLIYIGPIAGIGDDILGRILSDSRKVGEERFAGFIPAIKRSLCEQWHACEQAK